MGEPLEIAIRGLEIFAHHGLLPEERQMGQLFRFDIVLVLEGCTACESDEIAGTVDYALVADYVAEVVTAEDYSLLERLADVVASGILRRFGMVDRVRVTAAKPAPPVEHALEGVSVTVEQRRGGGGGL